MRPIQDISFTTNIWDANFYINALNQNRTVTLGHATLPGLQPGWAIQGYVREVFVPNPPGRNCKVWFRRTGEPFQSLNPPLKDIHQALADTEKITRPEAKRRNFLSLYGGPARLFAPYASPPWATSPRGFIAGAMQESLKHMKEKIEKEIGKEIQRAYSPHSYVTREECEEYFRTTQPLMSRCTPFVITEETKVFDKEKIKANRFYVGSRSTLERNWGHAKLEGAVGHATKMIEEERLEEEYFIVKIIKVVRRKKQPVVVEDVK